MVHLGVAFSRNLDWRRAKAVLLASMKIAPNNAEAHAEMGRVLINDNRPEQALAHLEKALALGAEPAENHLWTARALSALGRTAEALELLEKARAIAPKNPDCLFERALIHQALGDFDSARREFRKAMEMAPKAGRLHRSFLTSEKLQAGDPLIARMEDALRDPGLSDDSRANFGFALAKAMEDTGQHERVFAYLRPANELMSKRFPFDFDALRDQTHAMMESLADADFNSMDIPGRPDYAPLFVTGLPRSGTTLVEQIVASHSAVTGGGELGYARRAWDDALFGGKGAARPWSEIGGREVADIGRGIEARMRARFGDADRVTDKSVQSYMLMGPIMASLPESRFIVVKRDPRDNLLSMYRNIFADGRHRQSYSLRGLARHYRLHEEVLSFWQEKLPGGFHSVEYEKLVENPEAEARALIAACGLEWEDACLNFHKSGRKVDTLSLHQVRQPIYSSSLQAWRRHEGELTELLEELGGEYAPGAKPE